MQNTMSNQRLIIDIVIALQSLASQICPVFIESSASLSLRHLYKRAVKLASFQSQPGFDCHVLQCQLTSRIHSTIDTHVEIDEKTYLIHYLGECKWVTICHLIRHRAE